MARIIYCPESKAIWGNKESLCGDGNMVRNGIASSPPWGVPHVDFRVMQANVRVI